MIHALKLLAKESLTVEPKLILIVNVVVEIIKKAYRYYSVSFITVHFRSISHLFHESNSFLSRELEGLGTPES